MAPHLVCPRTRIKRLPSFPVQNSKLPTIDPSACVQVFPAFRSTKMSPGQLMGAFWHTKGYMTERLHQGWKLNLPLHATPCHFKWRATSSGACHFKWRATSSGACHFKWRATSSGVEWRGVAWSGVEWRGVAWSGVEWRGVAWSGVEWRGVAWSGVEWRGVA